MEILPILSAIILVGTVATLILAVAAYVLYKIRERQKSRLSAMRPSQGEQIHVLTAAAEGYTARALPGRPFELNDLQRLYPGSQPSQAATYVPPAHLQAASEPEAPAAPAFWEYTGDGYRPVQPAGTASKAGEDGCIWL